MKRFVWRLQRVLDIKRKEEQTKRAELLKITEKLARTRGELLMQRRILKNIIDSITEEHPKRRLSKQEFFLRCSATNNELIRKLESKVSELETRQREKIAEVLKVKRFKKSLEKLRAEAKTQFVKEQERLEQKEADEMTVVGFARKMTQRGEIDNPAS
jgi:flagellar FliJ protein